MSASLALAHKTFHKWLSDDYDTDSLDLILASLAVQRMNGLPLWPLILSGSGNAKTETVNTATAVGAVAVSTISSEGALLSASSAKDRAEDATGGLLREIGSDGVLVVKDMTSILSANGDIMKTVLGALREIYDGSWVRKTGSDGGKSLEWAGRLTVIGAVTSSWDEHQSAVSAMGDRFCLIRVDSSKGRTRQGRQAMANTGDEKLMAAELERAVKSVMDDADTEGVKLTDEEGETLLVAADLVTRARSSVVHDRRGNPEYAMQPEMPTRFAKQLAQIVRGGVAVGMDRVDAVALAMRVAHDSIPPLRLEIMEFLQGRELTKVLDIRKGVGKPRTTVKQELERMELLGLLDGDEVEEMYGGKPVYRAMYTLADDTDPDVLEVAREPDEVDDELAALLDEDNSATDEQVDGRWEPSWSPTR
ncbi:Uncharacterised protein [Acidipropionibacterium jensenii]|uniref:Uncharacterized protein n=1 Tax=Acidipropionibacterium jensenii TaxID=1749 RepID=A0A3S4YY20_9ACTN|nr:hypothetical protein [Acidipropionibacterium jensenii]VEI03738.1 Uncharacterised protein [Acidipropionibacterium jensenii]